MHERTQRTVARMAFMVGCALPTAITLACILATWTPWYHNRILATLQQRISRDTGFAIEIADFRRPTPKTLELVGIRIVDPETQREIARVREVHLTNQDHRIGMLLHQPELQSSQLPQTWRLVHDRFLCRPEWTSVPVQIACNDLTIHSQAGSMTLRDVDAWIRPYDGGVRATMQCLPAIGQSEESIQVEVGRHRDGETPRTQWALHTGATPLPCSALAEFLPLMDRLGQRATFTGSMRWQTQGDAWWIDLGGARFDSVSLDRVFERQSHRLSGLASIGFQRCLVDPHSHHTDIAGSIQSRDGMIGHSLLVKAMEELGFQVHIPGGLADSRGDVPYDLLAIGFKLRNTVLQLDGICSREPGYESFPPSVAMCLDLHPLVRTPQQPIDAVKLASLIAPAHSVQVPLARQTQLLLNVLVPPSRPLPKEQYFVPRIGSSRDWDAGPTIEQPR